MLQQVSLIIMILLLSYVFLSYNCSYYCNSATAKLFNFFSVSMLDSLMDKIDEMLQIIDKAAFNRDLWIGETSSTYGGGTPLYSSSYVAGFMLV